MLEFCHQTPLFPHPTPDSSLVLEGNFFLSLVLSASSLENPSIFLTFFSWPETLASGAASARIVRYLVSEEEEDTYARDCGEAG